MLTAKGNNYKTLLGIHTGYKALTLQLNSELPDSMMHFDLAKVVEMVNDRIIKEKIPSETLKKQLARIELHRDQLLDAYTKLFDCYVGMTTTQTRQSPIDKARLDMLHSITDMKMLRAMCAIHLGEDKASDYVLPVEKDKLITDTVAAMRARTD